MLCISMELIGALLGWPDCSRSAPCRGPGPSLGVWCRDRDFGDLPGLPGAAQMVRHRRLVQRTAHPTWLNRKNAEAPLDPDWWEAHRSYNTL